jgi:hypothetical protein
MVCTLKMHEWYVFGCRDHAGCRDALQSFFYTGVLATLSSSVESIMATQQEEGPFLCNYCHLEFTNAWDRETHKTISHWDLVCK